MNREECRFIGLFVKDREEHNGKDADRQTT